LDLDTAKFLVMDAMPATGESCGILNASS
jgi:hypothetical protein